MLGQKNWIVILVTSHSLQLYGFGVSEVQTIPLPATTIDNLEIINRDQLYTLITDWTKQRTYTNTNIYWLLAPDVCFEQTLTGTDPAKLDSETLQFLDTVPFEKVLSRVYPQIDGRKIVAVNHDLITGLMQGFALHGYTTKAVVPSQLAQADSTLTPEIAHYSAKHMAELSRESLITISDISANQPVSVTKHVSPPEKSKSSLPVLLAIFAILLAILLKYQQLS